MRARERARARVRMFEVRAPVRRRRPSLTCYRLVCLNLHDVLPSDVSPTEMSPSDVWILVALDHHTFLPVVSRLCRLCPVDELSPAISR